MRKKTQKRFPLTAAAVVGLIAGTSVLMYFLTRTSKLMDGEKTAEAFAKLDTRAMTPKQIWDTALEFNKERRIQLGRDLVELETLCHFNENSLKVAQGLRAFSVFTRRSDVPDFVKAALAEQWLLEFTAVHGFAIDHIVLMRKELRDALQEEGVEHPDDRAWRWGMGMALSMNNWTKKYALEKVRARKCQTIGPR